MPEPVGENGPREDPREAGGNHELPGIDNSTPNPPPVPPDALKPWYYQGWFIVPTFVWWPCSAVLFIRSPWHNSVLSGALSWAWIIIGGGWIFLRIQHRWQNGESLMDPTLLALIAPGIVLTVLTQSLWLTRDRPRIRRIRDAGGFAAYEAGGSVGPAHHQNTRSEAAPQGRSTRNARRRRRRRQNS